MNKVFYLAAQKKKVAARKLLREGVTDAWFEEGAKQEVARYFDSGTHFIVLALDKLWASTLPGQPTNEEFTPTICHTTQVV